MDDVIRMDAEFRELINRNAEEAWLEYCKQRGLDPDVVDSAVLKEDDFTF